MTRALRSTPTICTLSSVPTAAHSGATSAIARLLPTVWPYPPEVTKPTIAPDPPDRLIAGRVRVERVDFERDQLALGRRALALRERAALRPKSRPCPRRSSDPCRSCAACRSWVNSADQMPKLFSSRSDKSAL